MGEVVLPRLGDGTVSGLGDAEVVEGAGNDLEIGDRDAGSFDEVSRGGHIRGFFRKYKDIAV